MLTKSANENDKNKYLDECAKMCNDARGCEGFSFHLGDRLVCQFYESREIYTDRQSARYDGTCPSNEEKNTEKEKQLRWHYTRKTRCIGCNRHF